MCISLQYIPIHSTSLHTELKLRSLVQALIRMMELWFLLLVTGVISRASFNFHKPSIRIIHFQMNYPSDLTPKHLIFHDNVTAMSLS